MADQVALVPPLTAEAVKASINHMVDGMGQRDSWRYHFMLHQFVSNTPTALEHAEARKAGGMDAVKQRAGGLVTQPLAGLRVLDFGTRIAAPFCAGLLGEQGAEVIKIEQPRGGDFMREIGPFVDTSDGRYSLFWAVEGRGRKSVTIDLRTADGPGRVPPARGNRRRRRRELPARHARRLGHRPRIVAGPVGHGAHLHVRPRRPVLAPARSRSRRHRLRRVAQSHGYPDRPPVRVGVTISDYLSGVFAAHAAVAALYGRDARGGSGVVIDAALYGAVLRILEWTLAALRPAWASCAPAKATGSPTRHPSTTTRRATASTCASSPAPMRTSRGCARRWTGPT